MKWTIKLPFWYILPLNNQRIFWDSVTKEMGKYAQNVTEFYKVQHSKLNHSDSSHDICMEYTPFFDILKELSNDTKYVAL